MFGGNPAFLQALKKQKEKSDQHTTVGWGTGGDYVSSTTQSLKGGVSYKTYKSPISKLPFYTGNMLDKSPSGFTGLMNQGATCYLNSLLQGLFMTPELRTALYEWKYDSNKHPEKHRCVPYQLQKLFARLQCSIKGAVPTKDLTTSFGWKDREVYIQHDVLELADKLFEFLEMQAPNSGISDIIQTHHRGNYSDYVKCLKCNNNRARITPFVGVGLDIANISEASFNSCMKTYITPEILNENNKVNCDNCGEKQDHKKGIKFIEFPYFLNIYFRRWTLNLYTLTRIKIQKKIKFPLEFDAREYLNNDGYLEENKNKLLDNNNSKPVIYELYAIMNHSGGASGGHYFAYIKDFNTNKWYQFNDSKVILIPDEEIEKFFNPKEEEVQNKEESKNNNNDKTNKENNSEKKENKNEDTKSNNNKTNSNSITNRGGIDVGLAIKDALLNRNKTRERFKNAKIPSDYNDKTNNNNKKKRNIKPSFLNPMGAAYNLMYRLKDESRNINSVGKSLISKDLILEIEKEDELFKKHKEEFDRVKDLINLVVHYHSNAVEVDIKISNTLKETLDIVYEKLELTKFNIKRDWIRFRTLKLNIPKAPLTALDKTVKDLEFKDVQHIYLESHGENEEFPIYEPSKMQLRIIELDLKTLKYKKEILINVVEEGKIEDLRKEIAKALNIDNYLKVRIVLQCEAVAFLLDNDSLFLKKDQKLKEGDTLHVELCEESHKVGESMLLKKFDELLNNINLRFNHLLEEGEELIYDKNINIDVRCTIGELRKKLAKELNISENELVLRKNFNDKELKNNKKTLQDYSISVNGHVFCQRGTPLKPSEYLFNIFVEDMVYKQKLRDIDTEFMIEEQKKKEKEIEKNRKLKQQKIDELIKQNKKEEELLNKDNKEKNEKEKNESNSNTTNAPLPTKNNDNKDNNKAPQPTNNDNNAPQPKSAPLPTSNDTNAPVPAPVPVSAPVPTNNSTNDNLTNTTQVLPPPIKKSREQRIKELGEKYVCLGQVILDSKMKMKEVKEKIYKSLPNVGLPEPDFMRIREFSSLRLTKVYLDTKTLRGNTGRNIKDFWQLCIQKINEKEHLDKTKILLNIGEWYPKKMEYSQFNEISLNRNTKIKSELREILSKYSNIPKDEIQYVRPRTYHLKPENRFDICIADWELNKVTEISTITSKEWDCKHGDFILYKNKNNRELYSSDDFVSDFNLINYNLFSRQEIGITFYTPEQQIKREKEREELEKKEKLELNKTQKEMIERLAKVNNESAKKASQIINKSQNNE